MKYPAMFGDLYTRNGTILVVCWPGVYRRFTDEVQAREFMRIYRGMS